MHLSWYAKSTRQPASSRSNGARWEIETLFDVHKNGCNVEELQLDVIERIERTLALYLVMAWRIAYLMRMEHTFADLDASLFFDPDETQTT